MRPTQLATQCVAILMVGESEVKLATVLELCNRHTASLFVVQGFGGFRNDLFAVTGAMVATLFLMDDAPADEPVCLHHDRIDGAIALHFGLR